VGAGGVVPYVPLKFSAPPVLRLTIGSVDIASQRPANPLVNLKVVGMLGVSIAFQQSLLSNRNVSEKRAEADGVLSF